MFWTEKLHVTTGFKLVRDGIVIFTSELASLKRYKDDVKEVASTWNAVW